MMACEFSKEEVVMQKVNRLEEEIQEGAQRFGREYQKAAATGLDAASRSFGEANKGFQALAAEMMGYSKGAFDDAMRSQELVSIIAKVEATGPKAYVTALSLLENRFQFKRYIEDVAAETRRRGESG